MSEHTANRLVFGVGLIYSVCEVVEIDDQYFPVQEIGLKLDRSRAME